MYNGIYPNYVKSYLGVTNRQIAGKQEEKENSKSSQSAGNNQEQKKPSNIQTRQNGTFKDAYFPNGEKVSIDYTKKQIYIEQVLSDFRNTANAIGAPDDIKQEVCAYLELIETQARKNNPNQNIIQNNLKNASKILDEYITNTLKKKSNVVESWVDALFLQQIDFKLPQISEQENTAETQPDEQTEYQPVSEAEIQSQIYIPHDPQMKRMFIQAKKYKAIDQKEKALYSFQNAMDYAEKTGDEQTCALIHYEQGCLYDGFNRTEDALYNYDKAARISSDNNIKAKSHIYMGRIYDDYVILDSAIEHYAAAVSFSGESDNLKLQSHALNSLAKIHAEKYDKQNALMFMSMSSIIADETKDAKAKGIINKKNAGLCEKLSENARALNYYGTSSQAFAENNDYENLAKNYVNSAEIMISYGNKAKAKKLLSKAYTAAYQTGNDELKHEITRRIASL